jgi:hypothetical protein
MYLRTAADFFGRADFFAGLAFLARFVFGCGMSSDVFFSDSVVVFISFLLTGLRS